jgi:hypothetical protein
MLREFEMMHTSPLKREVLTYRALKKRLLMEQFDLDEETLADTLEGITDLHEMIAAVIRSALVDDALSAGLRNRLDDMKERSARLEERSAKKRQLALEAMDEAGLNKLQEPDFTASTRAGSASLLVKSEGDVPAPYWIPQPPRMDRQALLGELKRGAEIPGVQLNNPKPVLVVRTK